MAGKRPLPPGSPHCNQSPEWREQGEKKSQRDRQGTIHQLACKAARTLPAVREKKQGSGLASAMQVDALDARVALHEVLELLGGGAGEGVVGEVDVRHAGVLLQCGDDGVDLRVLDLVGGQHELPTGPAVGAERRACC